jgi:hypothetical protein
MEVLIAIIAVIIFARTHRSVLRGHGPVRKLATFKGIVIIETVQSTVFTFCSAHFVWHPTARISYRDLQVGLPNTLVCLEVMVAAVLFTWSFSAAPYRRYETNGPTERGRHGVLRGLAQVCNIFDLVRGFWWALAICVPLKAGTQTPRTDREGFIDKELASPPGEKGIAFSKE